MVDVYLSYSRTDSEAAQRIANAFKQRGLSVFVDLEIAAGQRFDQRLEEAMSAAKCVVVLWTRASVHSQWVRAEASYGQRAGRLIPVTLDPIELPLGFQQIQDADLSKWDGSADHPDFQRLVDAILRITAQGGTPTSSATSAAPAAPSTSTTEADRSAPPAEGPVPQPGGRIQFSKNRRYRQPWGASSTSIFVAHTTSDKPRIAPIVSILAVSGFYIWIDKPHLLDIEPRLTKRVMGIEFGTGDWKEQIRKGVQRAKVVLALWSDDAIDARREQFYYEVYMGLVQGKLCQARLDPLAPSKIGMPFTFDQIADLSDFRRDTYHAELDFMIGGFARFRRRLL